jgi:peptidoglycan hydrolase CwlO-like protein
MGLRKRLNLVSLVVLGVVVVLTCVNARVGSADPVQDPASLDRRISLVEQRFYTLESSMNRLQQLVASQRSIPPSSDTNDRQINQMMQEIQRLQLQLIEVQCGVLKLDERTTTRRAGDARPADPCRANPNAPLRFSPRQ